MKTHKRHRRILWGKDFTLKNGDNRKGINFFGVHVFFLFILSMLFISSPAMASQDEILRFIETKQKEIREKEEAINIEEERLNILKKEIEEKIDSYKRLLNQIEEALKKIEQINDDKLNKLVKTYESMSPEDAAARLSMLEDKIAVSILVKMKDKKASAIIAALEPRKAASITEKMANFVKNFPRK